MIDNLFSQDDDDDDLNLSLSIGRSTNKRRNSWKNKIIIDLEEESSGIGSSEDVQPVFSLDQSSHKSTDHINQYPCHGMIDCLVNGVNLHKGLSIYSLNYVLLTLGSQPYSFNQIDMKE